MTTNKEHVGFEVGALIEEDLRSLQRERRRHFLPAMLAWLATAGLVFTITGLRGGLFDQPAWQIAAQIGVWSLCLLVLPAVGLGLVFPSRPAKVALIGGTVAITVLASFDWQLTPGTSWSVGPCAALQTGVGLALLAIGAWSGAFVQRLRPSAGYWIAAGVALAALNTSTWHCGDTSVGHVMANHVGGGVAMLLCAAVLGHMLHRRTFRRG